VGDKDIKSGPFQKAFEDSAEITVIINDQDQGHKLLPFTAETPRTLKELTLSDREILIGQKYSPLWE
jgi:hypothetical protein